MAGSRIRMSRIGMILMGEILVGEILVGEIPMRESLIGRKSKGTLGNFATWKT